MTENGTDFCFENIFGDLNKSFMTYIEKRKHTEPAKNYVFANDVLKIFMPGFQKKDVNVVVNDERLEIRGESEDFGIVEYDAVIPDNTYKIELSVRNGVFYAKFHTHKPENIKLMWAE